MKIKIILSLFCLFLFNACTAAEHKGLRHLQKFTEELQSDYPNYNDADWEESINHYEQIIQSLDSEQLTEEERYKLGNLKGTCTAIYSKYALKIFEKELRNTTKELEGALKGFLDAIQ
jgi:hypothetical protein